MLIELHVIRDHGPSNMNRDKDGHPKTAFYAGTRRLRVSSQCLKRTLRNPRPARGPAARIGVFEETVGSSHFGVRTKMLPESVAAKWVEKHGPDAPFVEGIKAAVSVVAKKDGKQTETKSDGRVRTPQAIYLELDREVDRIVSILDELHAAGQLEQLADESQVFADQLKLAAPEIDWNGKDPSKLIGWESVSNEKNWRSLVDAFEGLDVPNRPEGLDTTLSADALVPTYEFARALLLTILAVKAEDEKAAETLLKDLAPPRGKTKSGARISLADKLKVTSDQPVSAADIALFGRMTTSDAFRDVEAACQVADAISTHPVDIESDYFTTVDDLDTNTGAAHLGESEYASAVFYHNLVVDFDALLHNLGAAIPNDKKGDEALQAIAAEAPRIAGKTVEGLLRAIMHNVPSGKINSHAHNQQPSLIFVEIKPRHLATNYLTAFHEPARAHMTEDGASETVLTDSVCKLLAFARYRDRKLGIPGTQRFLFAFDQATEQAIGRLRERLQQGQSSPLTDDEFFANSSLTSAETFEEFVTSILAAVRGEDVQ